MDGWTDGQTDGWTGKQMDKKIDGRMDGWVGGMDGRMVLKALLRIAQTICKKCELAITTSLANQNCHFCTRLFALNLDLILV